MPKTVQAGAGMLPYRRFAAVTVVIALIAAVFMSPDAGPSEPGRLVEVPQSELPRVTVTQRKAKPAALIAPVGAGAFPADEEVAEEEEAPASEPSAPAFMPGEKKSETKAEGARPSPDQVDRLVEASRARSGGIDQGDEPRGGG